MKKNCIMGIAALFIASASVFAAPNPAGDFKYDLNGEGTGVVIKGYLGSRSDVEIPAVIEGFPVVAIEGGAFWGRLLSSVVIPDSVTTIGRELFSQQDSLTKVTLPKNLSVIEDNVFSYCSALTAITIPAGVTSIGDGAFSNCMRLTAITIPAGVTSIGNGAFGNCRRLTTVTLSEGVNVGDAAFRYCSNLTTLNLPAGGVTFSRSEYSESNTAFEGCPKLTLAIRGKLKALGYEGPF